VQVSPSLQGDPSVLAGFEQFPVAASQVPILWQALLAVQVTGLLPVQTPPWQLSLCVQLLASLHVVPSVFEGLEQFPVDLSHVPALWH